MDDSRDRPDRLSEEPQSLADMSLAHLPADDGAVTVPALTTATPSAPEMIVPR
jgi:hypothetical protein